MQPALRDVVQNLTVPASAATASARFGAMMSFPSCRRLPRGSPKSSMYVDGPTTGKISRGTFVVAADAVPASRPPERTAARRMLRAVFRGFTRGAGSELEGPHANRRFRG